MKMGRCVALGLGLSVVMGAGWGMARASADVKVGDAAPTFAAKTHAGEDFDLITRKGKWTVLFFYPKADTPGCTKQACAFRDKLDVIRKEGAEVYGVSTDDTGALAEFHKKYKLNFVLLADPDAKVTESFGAKMPLVRMAKRWTFVVDPELKIRAIDQDVDPVKDAEKVAATLRELRKSL